MIYGDILRYFHRLTVPFTVQLFCFHNLIFCAFSVENQFLPVSVESLVGPVLREARGES